MVDIETNPLYYAAVGGLILGIATSLNYALRGKVTGMSGALYGIFSGNRDQIPEKISVVGGMLIASGIFFDIFQYGTYNKFTPFGPKENIDELSSYPGFAVAGLFVGFGTKLGNGCTSGHGLCGLARLSLRSFVAVIVFLVAAICVATANYHAGLGALSDESLSPDVDINHWYSANIGIGVGVVLIILGIILRIKNQFDVQSSLLVKDQFLASLVGLLFGIGLLVSGMVRRINILRFLSMGEEQNPSLLFVLGFGVLFNLIIFQYMIRKKKQSLIGGKKLYNPENSQIDVKLVLGALCFGIGWGIGGICPGPAIMLISVFTIPIQIIWFVGLALGMLMGHFVDKKLFSKQSKVEDQNKDHDECKVKQNNQTSTRKITSRNQEIKQ